MTDTPLPEPQDDGDTQDDSPDEDNQEEPEAG